MNSSDQNPALPTWIFIATDLALIGAAAVIALRSPHPLSSTAILWIVACIAVGAIVGLVPLLVRYERQKNQTLDERQQALEALARTVGSSADQISIATKGLHEIADLAHRNLRHAEQLPHKLQDKIAEFQAQLSATVDAEKEELERELLALRTTESERLEGVSQRIAKSSAEWTKLEAATRQHLSIANEAVAKLALGTAGAIGKAQAAAEQAMAQARVEAARAVGEAGGNATRAIESAKASTLAELDARLARATTVLIERLSSELSAKLAALPRATAATGAASPPVPESGEPEVPATTSSASSGTESADQAQPPAADSISTTPHPAAPKRLRKIRRDEPAANGSAAERTDAPPGTAPSPDPPAVSPSNPSPAYAAPADEPLPIPANAIPEITPVAPASAEPFSGHVPAVPNGSTAPVQPAPGKEAPPSAAGSEPAKSSRKRTAKKTESDDEPALGLELDDAQPGFASGLAERVLTSDGATRLLVTAYIGIGNRLFIRGEGPGLSWEKGTPLQFVSIGKWRWETNDASAPVRFKLYKNDELECSALGALSLDPGHQQEVTAAF
jgi:hypothetical protein